MTGLAANDMVTAKKGNPIKRATVVVDTDTTISINRAGTSIENKKIRMIWKPFGWKKRPAMYYRNLINQSRGDA